MPTTRIKRNYQVTIPKELFDHLKLDVGDLLDAKIRGNQIVLTPKSDPPKDQTSKLSSKDRQALGRALNKIERIQQDLVTARGLTEIEARVAIKAGILPKEQAYWWTEAWQKGERSAETDIRRHRIKASDTPDELITSLQT